MRGETSNQGPLFSYVTLEERVPQDHPLRAIRRMVDMALVALEPSFGSMYSELGRPSIPPEMLLRALLLQVLYGVSSERQLIEQVDYNLLFRWFVGLNMDDRVWNHSTFSKNRERLLAGKIADLFFEEIRKQAQSKRLLSREHFAVDGTLIEAAASIKSLRPREASRRDDAPKGEGGGRNPEVDFKGQKRSNATHESKTDPDAMLARKGDGQAAKLSYTGHVVTENRNGLIVAAELTKATGRAEVEAGIQMVSRMPGTKQVTVAGDKGYDTHEFVETLRAMQATPHVARKQKYSAIDGRTTRHDGYAMSQRRRKLTEERFGWMKTVGLLRKLRHRGLQKVRWMFVLTAAACNLVRMRRLIATA
jgi:transposase